MSQICALDQKPLAIDLFCGLGGWAEGLLMEGYSVVGVDNMRHRYPRPKVVIDQSEQDGKIVNTARIEPGWSEYPGQLVLQDVLTLHGSQFRDAALIVASPPCQNYSYLAMPWSRSKDPSNSKAAKALRLKWETEGPDNRLFDACFRIQREAIEATGVECPDCDGSGAYEERLADCDKRDWPCEECKGTGYIHTHYIPLIVENVRGAQPWVGRSAWNYGSFHLWGDVPALMPFSRGRKRVGRNFHTHALTNGAVSSPNFRGGEHETRGVGMGVKTPGRNLSKGTTAKFGTHNMGSADKIFAELTSPQENADGTKIGGDWFSDPQSTCRKHGSRSNARKMASAMIAKIPLELARHIAATYKPRQAEAA